MKKCEKTISGKHKLVYSVKTSNVSTGPYFIEAKDKPKICEYCGLIDYK